MRAVRSEGAQNLRVGEVPDPAPKDDEVLIDVVAAGVNRADLVQNAGHYPPPPGASEILGLECAGRIAAVGAAVDGWNVGDEVCALLEGGGYASRVAVRAGQVLPKPSNVDLVDAAGLPETVCTVWSNLVMLAHLRSGETLLVHGGSSGIGTTAIQVGRALGARVVVTVRNEDKAARCRELGADAAIVYPEQDFLTAVQEFTDGNGVDVILDVVGAAYLERNLKALAMEGRLILIATLQGRKAEIDLGTLLGKRAALMGTTLRNRPAEQKAAIVAGVREYAWPLVEEGHLAPVVDRVLPLDRAAEAHRVLEAGEHVGKVLLRL